MLFWIGIIWMGTYDGGKLKELRTLTTIKDVLTGRIPSKKIRGEIPFLSKETIALVISSAFLIVVSIINYFGFNGDLFESIGMFITGMLFIAFYLKHRKGS